MDIESGDLLKQLEEDGLAEDTIVFFYSDHGVGLPRSKRWLYDSGMRVPLIVHFPKKFQHLAPLPPGSVTDRLVSFVDFAPTLLSLAGVPIPEHMQGVAFLGPKAGPPREYVYGIRDRMDERHDIIRAVRDMRYKYIRNYRPDLPVRPAPELCRARPTMQSMRALLAAGKLSGPPLRFFQPAKPAEELYDTQADPHEINNLADSAEHRATLERLRAAHLRWMDETIDLGLVPECDLRERTGRCDVLRDRPRLEQSVPAARGFARQPWRPKGARAAKPQMLRAAEGRGSGRALLGLGRPGNAEDSSADVRARAFASAADPPARCAWRRLPHWASRIVTPTGLPVLDRVPDRQERLGPPRRHAGAGRLRPTRRHRSAASGSSAQGLERIRRPHRPAFPDRGARTRLATNASQ